MGVLSHLPRIRDKIKLPNFYNGGRAQRLHNKRRLSSSGRVYKHEKIPDAVRRVTKEQLGHELEHVRELGVFHHYYDDNFDNKRFGTQCIVFAVVIRLKDLVKFVKDDQHAALHWWNVADLKTNERVHQHTKDYFNLSPPNKIFKY